MENVVAQPTKSSLALRGIANILLGLIAITWPGLTLYILVVVFAINIIAVGTIEVFRPMVEKTSHAVLTVLLGILGILVGFYLLGRPVLTADLLGLIVAFWALLFGISDLMIGLGSKGVEGGYRTLFVIVGLISVLFGIYLLFYPVVTLVSFIWVLGVYAFVTGAMYVLASLFMDVPKKSKK